MCLTAERTADEAARTTSTPQLNSRRPAGHGRTGSCLVNRAFRARKIWRSPNASWTKSVRFQKPPSKKDAPEGAPGMVVTVIQARRVSRIGAGRAGYPRTLRNRSEGPRDS